MSYTDIHLDDDMIKDLIDKALSDADKMDKLHAQFHAQFGKLNTNELLTISWSDYIKTQSIPEAFDNIDWLNDDEDRVDMLYQLTVDELKSRNDYHIIDFDCFDDLTDNQRYLLSECHTFDFATELGYVETSTKTYIIRYIVGQETFYRYDALDSKAFNEDERDIITTLIHIAKHPDVIISNKDAQEILELARSLQNLALQFTAPQFADTYPEWNAVHNAGDTIERILMQGESKE